MGRADGRVRPGQNIATAFSARAWNRAQDAADVVLSRQTLFGADGTPPVDAAANVVLVKNMTGDTIPKFGVLGISGVEIDPSQGLFTDNDAAGARVREFSRRPILRGTTPTTAAHAEAFVVLLEPCPATAIARAAVSGCMFVRLRIVSAAHKFATVRNGDFNQLSSAQCGVMQLLWKEDGIGSDKWALGVM
jgi:hypothetical protein